MSYTFVKVSTFYPEALKYYYTKNSIGKDESYVHQLDHLMSQAFGWADFLSANLRKLKVNANEIVSNAELLQKAWAREHGIKAEGHELVLEQLKSLRPDVVFIDDVDLMGDWINRLREAVPGVRQVIGWWCVELTEKRLSVLRPFDYLLTCNPGLKKKLTANGISAYQFNHAFENRI